MITFYIWFSENKVLSLLLLKDNQNLKIMTTDKLKEFFEENDFNVHMGEEDGEISAEVETWTEGGVNMFACLQPFTIAEFEKYVNDFNVDEEIDLHRQGRDYCSAFTIKESLKDFTKFQKRLKSVLKKLKKLEK